MSFFISFSGCPLEEGEWKSMSVGVRLQAEANHIAKQSPRQPAGIPYIFTWWSYLHADGGLSDEAKSAQRFPDWVSLRTHDVCPVSLPYSWVLILASPSSLICLSPPCPQPLWFLWFLSPSWHLSCPQILFLRPCSLDLHLHSLSGIWCHWLRAGREDKEHSIIYSPKQPFLLFLASLKL